MNLNQRIKALFAPAPAEVIAVQELANARRQLLAALSAQEYANAMVGYYSNQVLRLTNTVKEMS